ncbi:MAG: 1-(5-phosphoribosyl)-5-[(5-phosphoribosylamino)methylideneamino]imidazole-4-carboxamide isomerase [Deltaproteobacteria bacterium]|nr:1-(5-phosphoribosyl)-5-[(5-phosphoribosylamino)methylideneamino]imidazole-4-carboxamide isomerase [Deltaproteobacteria bacterium]
MIIIPAIDIKGGKCVRLEQGKMDAETVYSTNPVEVALKWEAAGARIIHLVDLDAAIEGRPVNFNIIKNIVDKLKTAVQIGGGIRSMETAEAYLNIPGVERIIIGTAAAKDEAFIKSLAQKHPGKITVGIDAKDGKVAVKGWVEVTDIDAFTLAKKLKALGVAALVYTDISRDGMLSGPNLAANTKMAKEAGIPVIASGGVSGIEDIKRLKATGVYGAIIGKALYSGDIDLKEAIQTANKA